MFESGANWLGAARLCSAHKPSARRSECGYLAHRYAAAKYAFAARAATKRARRARIRRAIELSSARARLSARRDLDRIGALLAILLLYFKALEIRIVPEVSAGGRKRSRAEHKMQSGSRTEQSRVRNRSDDSAGASVAVDTVSVLT